MCTRYALPLLVLAMIAVGCGGISPDERDAGAIDAGSAACSGDEACEDGLFCNGEERCEAGSCVGAPDAPCSDGCNESADTCDECETDADGDGAIAISCGGDDCDDADAVRHPGSAEVCDTENVDEDCDPSTFGERDADRDGHVDDECCNDDGAGATACGSDCDDGRSGANPDVPEVCNGVDDDCDGVVDDGLLVPAYADSDGDMFGAGVVVMTCPGTPGYAAMGTDCDDEDVSIYPGANETCDSVDEDCDGPVDEDVGVVYFRDRDRDGFGVEDMTITACSLPVGYAIDADDCNDMSAAARPFGVEICDGVDNDCNGMIDEVVGSECSVGIGACEAFGRRRCDGSCSATSGTPVTALQTAPAPNGSWDWDCDGLITPAPTAFVARNLSSNAQVTTLNVTAATTIIPFSSTPQAACMASACGYDLACHPTAPTFTPMSCGAPLRCVAREHPPGFGFCAGITATTTSVSLQGCPRAPCPTSLPSLTSCTAVASGAAVASYAAATIGCR